MTVANKDSSTNKDSSKNEEHWLCKLQDNIIFDLFGGPRVCQIRYIINTFKFLTFFYLVFLMWFFQNFTHGAYLYAALHGSYGWLWVFKDLTFPDKTWQREVTFGSFLVFVSGNLLFWSMPVIMISGLGIQDPTKERLAVSIIIMLFGSALMLVADAQKTFTLKYKQGLINDGVFKYTRNPNYLGETMIYLSFAVATGHWLSYSIVLLQGGFFFNVMTKVKDIRSYSKKEGWEEYRKVSGRFFPKFSRHSLLNLTVYGILTYLIYFDYSHGGVINYLKKPVQI